MGNGILEALARFAVETGWRELPASIVRQTKHVLLDSIGCALGAATTDKGRMNAALARRLGGSPQASIIGLGGKVSCDHAALANGELMLALDFSNIMGGGHDGAYVIPAVLAMAESAGASGRDLIAATAVGLEVASRLARAVGQHNITPQAVQRRRAAAAGLSGNAHTNFGAVAGAGRLLRLDAQRMAHALGLAGHLCMVLSYSRWSYSRRGHMSKYGVPGWQGTGAVSAALLAEMGYTGDVGVLDDPEHGFAYYAGYPSWYPEEITDGLGARWCFDVKLHYKPYPCCGVFHGPLDCFYEIIEKNDLAASEIESVTAYCRAHLDAPLFAKKSIDGISDAQFNGGYVFGVAAHRVPRGVEWYDPDTMSNPAIRAFADKVACRNHPGYGRELERDPLSALSKVEVLARGRTFSHEVKYRRGSAGTEAALSEAELVEKFRHNAERILTRNQTEQAVQALLGLEDIEHLSALMRAITL
ncbi:MAG: MmgE/PrpD family protein [Burkholderiales bacterium]|nr:MmgE/PrpD family protein [Burkholderiales bacterium]